MAKPPSGFWPALGTSAGADKGIFTAVKCRNLTDRIWTKMQAIRPFKAWVR